MPDRGDTFVAAVGYAFTDRDRYGGRAMHVGDNLLINGHKIEIVGVLERQGGVEDDGIFINEDALRAIANVPERYSMIVAQLESEDDIPLATEAIAKNLRSSRGVKERQEDFVIQTPSDFIASFNAVIGGVTYVLVGIAGISLIVGGIGIMNTMYTAVLERTREIGIMKAVGARNRDVLTIFLFESGLLGLVGGLIGVLSGVLMSQFVVFAGSAALGPGIITAQFSPQLIGGALLFSFLVGALAGTLPAYEASKLPPVEALQQ
jgi:putative ABC transport system permease protein